ncbi:response regulator [Paenibacillus mendelii]|uniref:histidine kinase n=1 Tax=Paenibacillus mendelii TaxID=206163 RepID=A0ABV6JFY5_9BACL|nr:response regulator [Paenibacillus mendelii]MCQ6562471.1 response regulator [Paenibacillus mendelii]
MLRKMSLRVKVLILVIWITTIPLSIVGIGNYTTAKQTIMDSLIEKASSKVVSNASNLSSWIDTRRAEAEVMSRTDRVRYGTEEMREDYFQHESRRAQSPYLSIGFADLNGVIRLSDGNTIRIDEEPWFRHTLEGVTTVTEPFTGRVSGERIFVIQVPVFGEDQEVIGLVNASLPLESVYENYLSFQVGESDVVMLYNDEGSILYHPDQRVAVNEKLSSPELPYAPIAADLLEWREGYRKFDDPEGRSMFFFASVGGTTWKIGMEVPLSEFEKPLKSLLVRTIAYIVLAVAVMTLLLLLLTSRILKRIKRVLEVTEAASAGQFDVLPVPEAGNDEIAQLAYSVNDMTVHLRDMFDRMEAIINQNEYAFIVMDDEYRVTYFSKAAERMLGYRAEEVLHTATALTFIDQDDMRAEAEMLSRKLGRKITPDINLFHELRKEHFSYEREWMYVRKDGTKLPVSHSSNGIRDRSGNFIGVVGIARDITEQRRTSKAQSQQLDVMEAAKDLIATFDEQGKLLYINPAGRTLLGLSPQQGEELKDEVPKRIIDELLEGVAGARARGYRESEALLFTVDGNWVHVSKILVAHRDELTRVTFFSCIARDITEQKRVQGELEEAKREAEEASRAKSDFLARMSHEIRTPLAGIIGLTRLMQKTGLSDLQRDYLDKMWSSSEALQRIINDVLDLAKVEAGKIELSEVAFNPEQLLQKLADLLSMFVGGKEQFEFIIETPDTMPSSLIGDPLRLEQVLLNLCVNAVKFTNFGHVRLRLEQLEDEQDDYAVIRFTVEDTGIGISEEQLPRLFEPFNQAGVSTTRKYGGTGLGLVIAKSLVDMMGGAIEVKSEKGVGSQFTFTLRFAAAAPASNRYRIGKGGEHAVWVVEDYELTRTHWSAQLEEMGMLPIEYATWRSAQDRLMRAGIGALPNALLLDFEMPDMFGDETWHSLHKSTQEAGVPTIAITTAFGREELLKLPLENRPDAILVKPVSRISLYQGLYSVLERAADRASITETAADLERPEHPKGNILLAEDNVINQLVAVEQLREWGFSVEVAENGREVLEKLEGGHWDLILMDIHMPEMDGDEATRIIRTDSRFDRLPIVALTANVIREDHERYMQLGMNDVLTKPIDEEKMFQVIVKWLRTGSSYQTALPQAAKTAITPPWANEEEPALTIPGIDEASALERVNGKRDILNHMLKLFVRDYAPFCIRMEEALRAGDYTQARRMAHTLKGVAGNLSAGELAATADQLETLLKQPAESIDRPSAFAAAACVRIVIEPILTALMQQDTTFDNNS